MPLVFPNSPSIGEQTTGINNVVYEWDGEKWRSISTADTPTLIASGDTKAQVTDTGGDGQFKVFTENTEQFTISPSGDATLLSQNELRFSDADNSNYVGLKAPTAASGNIVWTLPPADGIAEQVLGTNGSGELYWTAGGGASVVVSSGAPASPDVGDVWFDTDEMRSYVYYDDGTSSQWVEMNPSWNGTVDDGSITPAKLSTGGPSWTASGDFSVDTNTLYVDAANNRVGLGTSSVGYALHLKQPNNGFSGGLAIESSVSTQKVNCLIDGNNKFTVGFNEAQAVALDDTGRVGIGTTSPGDKLHVVGPTAGISARFSDGINATVAISHPSAGTSQISDYGGNYGLQFTSGSVNILTAGSERARIDNSGRVTMPYQPAFSAAKSDDANQVAAGVYVFNQVHLNRGSYYSTSTGRFTAPVAGAYYFVASLQLYGGSAAYCRFQKNGNDIYTGNTSAPVYEDGPDAHETITFAAVIDLGVNDYVTVERNSSTRGMQSSFSGFLIG